MKAFGHKRPVRGDDGSISEHIPSPARARTVGVLDGRFGGGDRGKRIVVTLAEKDQIVLRIERSKRQFQIGADDLWLHLCQCEANRAWSARMAAKKSAKAQRLADQRQRRAERRLIHRGAR